MQSFAQGKGIYELLSALKLPQIMSGKVRSAIIITKKDSSDAEKAAHKVANLLASRKVTAYCASPLRTNGCETIELTKLSQLSAEVTIAIGGDGTTLRAFRVMPPRAGLMSVNVGGHRGILAEIDTSSLEEGITQMIDGKCHLDPRMRIQASIEQERLPPALNDILITRKNITRTPLISIQFLEDQFSQRMDGVLVATPTGSTGHSYSIGGPVIHEEMSCVIICPIAPVNRVPCLVVPPETIVVTSNHDSYVVVDGQEAFDLPAGRPIKLARHANDACFLRLKKRRMRQLDKLGFYMDI